MPQLIRAGLGRLMINYRGRVSSVVGFFAQAADLGSDRLK